MKQTVKIFGKEGLIVIKKHQNSILIGLSIFCFVIIYLNQRTHFERSRFSNNIYNEGFFIENTDNERSEDTENLNEYDPSETDESINWEDPHETESVLPTEDPYETESVLPNDDEDVFPSAIPMLPTDILPIPETDHGKETGRPQGTISQLPNEVISKEDLALLQNLDSLLADTNTMMVYNQIQLQAALYNESINNIYIMDDFSVAIGPLRVRSDFNELHIFGGNHTITDMTTSIIDRGMIYVEGENPVLKDIIIEDLNIVGSNMAGFISISLPKVDLILNNITYTGPKLAAQHSYNAGYIAFTDLNAHINEVELVQGKNIFFEGTNTVSIRANSGFNMPYGGLLRVEEDAIVDLSYNYKYYHTFIGFFVALDPYNTPGMINIEIGEKATFKIKTNVGLIGEFDDPSGNLADVLKDAIINNIRMEDGSNFYIDGADGIGSHLLTLGYILSQEELSESANWKIGSFNVGHNCTVELKANLAPIGTGVFEPALLKQDNGQLTIESGSTFRLISNTATHGFLKVSDYVPGGSGSEGGFFGATDPKQVFIYTPLGRPFTPFQHPNASGGNAFEFYVDANQFTYVPKSNNPIRSFRNEDHTAFQLRSSAGFLSLLNISFYNVVNDPMVPRPYYDPRSDFGPTDCVVMAFGEQELRFDKYYRGQTFLSGWTDPDSEITLSYLNANNENVILSQGTSSDSDGNFHIPVHPSNIPEDIGKLMILSEKDYLFNKKQVPILTGTGPTLEVNGIEFEPTAISSKKEVVKRKKPDWSILVTAGEGASKNHWKLKASVKSHLATDNLLLPELTDAIIYVNDLGISQVIPKDEQLLIYENNSNDESITISWDENKGILLSPNPGTMFADKKYTTIIQWNLELAP